MVVYNTRVINNCVSYCYKTGERYCTANVHMLRHFSDSVRHLGPLWCHSAFPFEDTNGWLKDMFHGNRNPPKQVNCIN